MKALSILSLPILILGLSHEKTFAQSVRDTSDKNALVEPILANAEFPGGPKEFKKFVQANIRPVKGANGKRVFISFTVDKNGGLSHFKIERGLGMEADSEAMRVIRLSPRWKPGVYNGQPESSFYTAPIVFPK